MTFLSASILNPERIRHAKNGVMSMKKLFMCLTAAAALAALPASTYAQTYMTGRTSAQAAAKVKTPCRDPRACTAANAKRMADPKYVYRPMPSSARGPTPCRDPRACTTANYKRMTSGSYAYTPSRNLNAKKPCRDPRACTNENYKRMKAH
jgi:hypothetical protein